MSRTRAARRGEPLLSRSDVARILNITPLTISNREKRKQYPTPRRDLNGYRLYSLNDVLDLQLITYGTMDTKPILSVLYDVGYRDPKEAARFLDHAFKTKTGRSNHD